MALQTEIGFAHYEQIVVDRTMRSMTSPAILGQIGVLIEKGAFFFGMTLRAGRFHGVLPQVFVGAAAMGIMAIGAKHFFFRYGVVVRERKSSFYIRVASVAHFSHVPGPYFKVMARVDRVTIGARHFCDIMRTRVPVMQIEGSVR